MTPLLLDLELRALGVVPRAEPKPEPPAPPPVWLPSYRREEPPF